MNKKVDNSQKITRPTKMKPKRSLSFSESNDRRAPKAKLDTGLSSTYIK
jgi:hypothetical protein